MSFHLSCGLVFDSFAGPAIIGLEVYSGVQNETSRVTRRPGFVEQFAGDATPRDRMCVAAVELRFRGGVPPHTLRHMALVELPPDPVPSNEEDSRLQRLEVKVNILIVLVSILILYPIVGWLFGVVQTSAWLMLLLLVAAFFLAVFRSHIPGAIKKGARWLVLKAVLGEGEQNSQ